MPKTPMLSDADVERLIGCADLVIGRWAVGVRNDKAAKTYCVFGAATGLDCGDGPAMILSYDDLRTAFVALAALGKLPAWQMREIATGNLRFDSAVGDLVVQWALFGQIAYD
jgi:hypothetical protein